MNAETAYWRLVEVFAFDGCSEAFQKAFRVASADLRREHHARRCGRGAG